MELLNQRVLTVSHLMDNATMTQMIPQGAKRTNDGERGLQPTASPALHSISFSVFTHLVGENMKLQLAQFLIITEVEHLSMCYVMRSVFAILGGCVKGHCKSF